jgi:phosphoglycerate dehydrogenase-like enzyme
VTRIAVALGFHSWAHELTELLAPDDVVMLPPEGDAGAAAGADAAIGGPNPDRFRAVLAAAPGLRWYHTLSAGVERLIVPELTDRAGLVLTNNSGAYDLAIAEHVVATIFAAAKHLPTSFAAQARREWHEDPRNSDVGGATLVVLGMGSIGGELARIARALGMRVIGIRRGGGDGAVTPDRLGEAAAEADYLVVCAPLTAETRGMVDADVIARLRPTAWLINISRGAVVDERALLDALRERRIGGAAIDAWWTEPLPADSEWWDLPNVIVTPHTSFSSPSVRERSIALVLENLRRFKAGEPLLNRVDPRAGY